MVRWRQWCYRSSSRRTGGSTCCITRALLLRLALLYRRRYLGRTRAIADWPLYLHE